jgi:hypothetical protein
MASDASPDLRMVSISSMIVELSDTMSPRDGKNIEWLTYQSTLFPAPAAKGESHQLLRKRMCSAATDVSRGSIGGNSVQMLSIPRACRLERTMSLYRCTAIRGRRCNFSMDRGERAKYEYLSATGYLAEKLSISFPDSNGNI